MAHDQVCTVEEVEECTVEPVEKCSKEPKKNCDTVENEVHISSGPDIYYFALFFVCYFVGLHSHREGSVRWCHRAGVQAKHSDDDGEDDGDDGEDGDDEDVNVLFLKKKRPAIILYLLKVRLLSLSIVTFHKKPIAGTYMTQLLLLGKVEYGGGPIFKVVLEC